MGKKKPKPKPEDELQPRLDDYGIYADAKASGIDNEDSITQTEAAIKFVKRWWYRKFVNAPRRITKKVAVPLVARALDEAHLVSKGTVGKILRHSIMGPRPDEVSESALGVYLPEEYKNSRHVKYGQLAHKEKCKTTVLMVKNAAIAAPTGKKPDERALVDSNSEVADQAPSFGVFTLYQEAAT